jgi:tRNA 2-selenouridine synthase
MSTPAPTRQDPCHGHPPGAVPAAAHPSQLEVQDFAAYALVIDARSPHEYDEDHIPGAVNLPVVNDEEFAAVGITYRTDPHAAYMLGAPLALRNIAGHIQGLMRNHRADDRFLVYCFRGGKRSRVWADNLRAIGFSVDVLPGGWKKYRAWVRGALQALPAGLRLQVLCGPTNCGKTRLLHALAAQGAQVLELEGLARHRGSLLGSLPGQPQPTQKYFDSLLLEQLLRFDPARPVWVEAESKKIGNLQLPDALVERMHAAPTVHLAVPMAERVRMCREDYPNLATAPGAMVDTLEPLKPLLGGKELALWRELATQGQVDALFERVMVAHYDPCYARSTGRNYGGPAPESTVAVESLAPQALAHTAARLMQQFT